jgi:polar amino acid transport system substrate-binding protein
VSPNAAPLVYKGAGGQIDGVEGALAKKLAARLGKPVQFVSMPFDKLLPALQAGKVDIVMSGVTVTTEREALVEFADPYMISGQALMVRSNDIETFVQPEIIYLLKTKIGVERGSIAETLAQRCREATVVPYSSIDAATAGLRSGSVRCVMGDAPVVWLEGARNEARNVTTIPRLLTREYLAWAVRRGDTGMLESANGAIRDWRADGSLHATLSRYIPRYELLMRL